MKTVEKIRFSGNSIFSFPYKIFYADNVTGKTHFIISVPKKIHKRAVKRNLIRRRIREVVRIDLTSIPNIKGKDILLVYISGEIFDYEKIRESLKEAILKISC